MTNVIPFPNSAPLTFPCTGHFAPHSDLAAVEVHGDHMDPTLRRGDRVVIDTTDVSLTDGLFVLNIEGSPIVYRVTIAGFFVFLSGDSPLYAPHRVERGSLDVLGRVVWIVTRV